MKTEIEINKILQFYLLNNLKIKDILFLELNEYV